MAKHADEHFLDVDFEVARSIHRVVRAMHDGECPKCHAIVASELMRWHRQQIVKKFHYLDLVCPKCGFTITHEDAEAAIAAFAPVMEKNLAVFEQWRASREVQP